MTGGAVSLDRLEAAYRRVSRTLYRAREDALDFVAEDIIATLEEEEMIGDAAFFVLIFGQIETRVNELAARGLRRSDHRAAMRDAKFEKRLMAALPGSDRDGLRQELDAWHRRQSTAAHGEAITGGYNISRIFDRARELDALLGE